MYPPTPYRRQSKTFLTIDQRHRRIQRGGEQGVWTPAPLKKKKIGFPKQYLCGSLKNQKTTNVRSQHSMLVLHRPASETSRNVSQAGRWWCQSWTPSDSAHERLSKSLETVFSIAICRHCGDKLQFKTLLPTILSTFVDHVNVLDCRLSDEPPSYLLSLLD